jgi:hypothetical protein
MSPRRTLWALERATPDTLRNAGLLADALRLHIEQAGLTTLVVQIGDRQQAYLQTNGCPRCHQERCIAGCRVQLLQRGLRAGLPASTLRLVRDGLQTRPYRRTVLAWPTAEAQALDASLIHPWRDARLVLHWHREQRWGQPAGLTVGAVLTLSDGGPDPLSLLRTIGWNGYVTPFGRRLARLSPRSTPLRRPWSHDPHVLLPVPAARWLIDLPASSSDTADRATLLSQSHAATITMHTHAAGARVEFLDLHADTWTATLAATAPDGQGAAALLDAMTASDGPLRLHDRSTATVKLDPAAPRPPDVLPPLLRLGMRPNGTSRWRPLSSTHHLLLVGSQLAGVIAGLLAPLVAGHPELRVGLLDTADGDMAARLVNVPGRFATADSSDVQELLGLLGSLEDRRTPSLVVVYAEDGDACEAAIVPLLRAASYVNLSLIIAAPHEQALPELITHRLPIIRVRNRQAQWQAPHGHWRWASPTLLRLPWRDPTLGWTVHELGHRSPLLPTAGFWSIPPNLHATLVATDQAASRATDIDDVSDAGADDRAQDRAAQDPPSERASSSSAAPAAAQAHLERVGRNGLLIIDARLIVDALRWAADADNGQGVTIKQLTAGLGLETRVQGAQLVDALLARGLASEVRDGWYRLVSVDEAKAAGHLVQDNEHPSIPVSERDLPFPLLGAAADTPLLDEAHGRVDEPPCATSNDECVTSTTKQPQVES